ncbi:hypothetical protein [Massilia horti]|uniref:DUF2127 domain-containing protein n=1 Tax=Massilia horti TaxID=2562153 RepID=A0A4Y9SZ49_9BURK|nr:hypothetical protein [Massilia horti]TFW30494.1 hypothetical protein E4O92_16385 [Massilia horti]TFW30587.1 hypothetical protein E4O92_16900 [Massilia horti]
MAEKKSKNWWWPTITDQASAIEASKAGYWAAVIVAVVTAAFATFALMLQKEIVAVGPLAYIDAVLFAVIAWRIKKYSKFFAVAGVVLFVIEKALLAPAQGVAGLPLAIVVLLMFVNGARGVFAYHRYAIGETHAENV